MAAFIIAPLAASFGFLGSLLGVGGGIFLVPAMVLGLDIEPVEAMPISLMCVLATGLSGAFLSQISDAAIRKTLLFEPAALIGALMAAPIAYLVNGKYILWAFAIFVLLIAIVSSKKSNHQFERPPISERKSNILGLLVCLISGASGGLFGIGGGILLVPLLKTLCNIPIKEAMQISLYIMISTSVISLLVHASAENIPWATGLLCMACVIPSGFLGAWVRRKAPDDILSKLFVVLALAMGIAIFLKAGGW